MEPLAGLATPALANPQLQPFQTPQQPKALQILQGLEGLSQKVAAGFADSPRVRAYQQARIDQDQQQQQAQRQEWGKILLEDLNNMLPAAQQAVAKGGITPALQKTIDESFGLLGQIAPPEFVEAARNRYIQQIQQAPAGEGFTLGEGQQRFDAAGNVIAAGAPQTNPLTEKITAAETQLGRKLTEQEIIQMSGAAQPPAASTTVNIPATLTDAQSRARGFGQRASSANDRLNQLENSGYRPTWWADFMAGGSLESLALSDNDKKYLANVREFTRATLRKESGATITDDEIRGSGQTYIPTFGDSNDIVSEKRQLRQNVIDSLALEADIIPSQTDPGFGGTTAPPLPETQPSGSGAQIEQMTIEQLNALDPSSLSEDELRRAAARYDQLQPVKKTKTGTRGIETQ